MLRSVHHPVQPVTEPEFIHKGVKKDFFGQITRLTNVYGFNKNVLVLKIQIVCPIKYEWLYLHAQY